MILVRGGTLTAVMVVALAATAVLGAGNGDAASVTAGLQGWLDGTRTLEGRFEQILISEAFGSDEAEVGTLYIHRPGRMRWNYTSPEEKTVLLHGRETSMYFAEDRQMIRGTLDDETDLLPSLLAGDGRLSELFLAELAKAEAGSPGLRLRLVPRGEGDVFEEAILTLDPGSYAIESAEVLDGAGNRMEYRFHDLRRNASLPAGIFSFEPPPGTEIVDGY